jgi:pimeloyl-ACP methyl ester carboxylesterase
VSTRRLDLDIAEPAGVFVGTAVGDVHVVVDGDPAAPAVACVHGIPGATRDFRAFAAHASALGLCTVRIDMPGFGRSPQSAPFLRSPVERAGLVRAVMQARGHRRYGVFGHSFGGTVALALAATARDDVTALVLCNSVGTLRHRGLQVPHELLAPVKHVARIPVLGPRALDVLTATYARMGIKSDRPLGVDDVVAHTSLIGALDFAEQRLHAAAVRAPTLVLSAADDPLVEPMVGFALAAAIGESETTVHRHHQRGGHYLQKRDAAAIAAFCAGHM